MKKKQAIRKAFRDVCLQRDNHKCVVCHLVAEPDGTGEYRELEVREGSWLLTSSNLLRTRVRFPVLPPKLKAEKHYPE